MEFDYLDKYIISITNNTDPMYFIYQDLIPFQSDNDD